MLALFLVAGVFGVTPAGDWQFVDESARDGRSIVTFKTVELADSPSRPLLPHDKPPAGSKFGSVALGPGGNHRLGVVWHADTSTLWFDADGDGRYAGAERYTLGARPLEAKVLVPFDEESKQPRTVMIRKRGDGLAWAVRGYTIGTITLNGKTVAAMLTDGNADGCFDGVEADRVWLDLDGDGRFDPLTEQFPLGTAILAGGTAVLIRPQPDGLTVKVRERPNETGTLVVRVATQAKAEVVELAAQYVSEFGELVVVREAAKPVAVPVGRYRTESVRLRLAGDDGQVWQYSFAAGDRAYDVEVSRGRETVQRPLEALKLTINHDAEAGAVPGALVLAQPDVTAGGLYLTGCQVGSRLADHGRDVFATIELIEPGSVSLDRASSGFS